MGTSGLELGFECTKYRKNSEVTSVMRSDVCHGEGGLTDSPNCIRHDTLLQKGRQAGRRGERTKQQSDQTRTERTKQEKPKTLEGETKIEGKTKDKKRQKTRKGKARLD